MAGGLSASRRHWRGARGCTDTPPVHWSAMAKSPITAASLGIARQIRVVREVLVLPPGGLKTTRVKERPITLAAIADLDSRQSDEDEIK